jgi:hypothetical protein
MKTRFLFLIILTGLLMFCSPAEDPIPEPTYDGITSIEGVPSPVEGFNYYRLNQFDYDGQNEIHDAFVVQQQSQNARVLADYGIVYDFDESTISTLEESCWSFSHNEFDMVKHRNGKGLHVKAPSEYTTKMFNFLSGDVISFEIKKDDKHDDIKVKLYVQNINDKKLLHNLDISNRGNYKIDLSLDKDYSNSVLIFEAEYSGTDDATFIFDDLIIDSSNSNFIISDQCQLDLPITLLWQKATVVDLGILIQYETATEFNSDYVQVEWSIDAKNWIAIGYIPSNNQPSTYSFLHK